MNNKPGEWCVAYHGIGRNQPSNKVKNCVGSIYKDTFQPGSVLLQNLYRLHRAISTCLLQ